MLDAINDRPLDVFKVVHAKDGVETVYLVTALSSRDAKRKLLDELYGGLDQWTPYKICREHRCAVNAQPFRPDPSYKLYSINTKTGEMTL